MTTLWFDKFFWFAKLFNDGGVTTIAIWEWSYHYRGDIKVCSVNTESDYKKTDQDEDLIELLQTIKDKIEFDAVCSGAILSDYQRVSVEHV